MLQRAALTKWPGGRHGAQAESSGAGVESGAGRRGVGTVVIHNFAHGIRVKVLLFHFI